jgi:hypothetical protein
MKVINRGMKHGNGSNMIASCNTQLLAIQKKGNDTHTCEWCEEQIEMKDWAKWSTQGLFHEDCFGEWVYETFMVTCDSLENLIAQGDLD